MITTSNRIYFFLSYDDDDDGVVVMVNLLILKIKYNDGNVIGASVLESIVSQHLARFCGIFTF